MNSVQRFKIDLRVENQTVFFTLLKQVVSDEAGSERILIATRDIVDMLLDLEADNDDEMFTYLLVFIEEEHKYVFAPLPTDTVARFASYSAQHNYNIPGLSTALMPTVSEVERRILN